MKKNIVRILCIWVIIILVSLSFIYDCKKPMPSDASIPEEQKVTDLDKNWSVERVSFQNNEDRTAD